MAETKYKLNPDWPADTAVINGVPFDSETVVEGEQWKKFSRPMFKGKPSQLVVAPNATVVTKPAMGTPAARQEIRDRPKPPPSGPSQLFSTAVMQMEAEKEKIAEEEAKAEEVAEKTAGPEPTVEPELPKVDVTEPIKIVKPEHEKRAEEEADKEEAEMRWLYDIKGVGQGRAQQLEDAGYKTIADVAKAEPQDLLEAMRDQGARINLATARAIVKNAKRLIEG